MTDPSDSSHERSDEHITYRYLTVADVLEFFADAFGCTPDQARDQLRQGGIGGLEGALARPQNYAIYAGADLVDQAAVLAHGIAEGQYFIDGNKRMALVALTAFLDRHGYDLLVSEPELARWIERLSEPDATPEELAERLRAHLVEVPEDLDA